MTDAEVRSREAEARSVSGSAAIVRDTLVEYAERGVFRGFEHREHPGPEPGTGTERVRDGGGARISSFRFFWLGPRPFHITLDPTGDVLTARGLLPSVDAHPGLRKDLERLVAERAVGEREELDAREAGGREAEEGDEAPDTRLPPHRRIDPEKVSVALDFRREGDLDLVLTIREDHHEYAVRKLLNLINEIWIRLQDRHQRYMWEELEAPME